MNSMLIPAALLGAAVGSFLQLILTGVRITFEAAQFGISMVMLVWFATLVILFWEKLVR